MPNQIDNYGLQVNSNTETLDALKTALQSIYGDDISLESNSPDGQNVNIFAQAITDLLELLMAINNSFDVESANGIVLDQRVALNGISRKPGTFTVQPISITSDRALTLPGLDAAVNDINGDGFTVADAAGNEWILISTTVFSASGTQSLSFRSKTIGLVATIPNTITNQITVTTGVTAVNNPLSATTVGTDEESDVQLKIRRVNSFKLQSINNADALEAALLTLPGVTDALVVEDDDAHTVWCIVEGGTSTDIAATIYAKRGAGCGLVGDDVTVVVARPNGQTISIVYDVPITQALRVKATLTKKNSSITFDQTSIKMALAAAMIYSLKQPAIASDITAALMAIEPAAYLSVVAVSINGTDWYEYLATTDAQHKFTLSVGNITLTEA